MKRRWPIYRALLFLTLTFAVFSIAYKLMYLGEANRSADLLLVAALGLIILVLVIMLAGLWSFQRNMARALRWLLEANFDNRIRARVVGTLAGLVDLVNRVTEQLGEYETLRSLRTGYANRAMYVLLNRLTTPGMIVDLPRRTGRVNPACQRALELTTTNVGLEFIFRQDVNKEFVSLFNQAFAEVKRERTTACMLRLTPGSAPREVEATFIPIKGDNDEIELGLVMLTLRAQTPSKRSPAPNGAARGTNG